MKNNIYLVVSDKFTNYHKLDHCITYNNVVELLETERNQTSGVLIISQGISDEQIAFLNAKIREKNSAFVVNDSSYVMNSTASKKETHKHNKDNVLISSPEGRDGFFKMSLLVNERGELLQDHITGYHLQGMLLIEAARQAFLAVTEKFYCYDELPSAHYFVINSLDIKYLAFVFVLETNIELTVQEHVGEKGRQRFHTRIDFKQNDVVCTSIQAEFTVFDALKLKQKELELANSAIDTIRDSLISNSRYTKVG